MKDTEKDIEKNIAAQLSSEDEVAFKVSDDELVKRATVSANNQQGTKDLYTYNYWSSPVGISNATTNNNGYTLPDVLSDGSVATTPLSITFVTGHSGAPGSPGATPISIASTWIWKYANKLSDDYEFFIVSIYLLEFGQSPKQEV